MLSLPLSSGAHVYIYIYIYMYVQAPLSIRWDIDGDIHSLFVTPL